MLEPTLRVTFRLGERASFVRTVLEEDVQSLARLMGDAKSLHTDAGVGQEARFDRIADGVYCEGLISAVLANQLPGPGSVYLSQQTEFLAPVGTGDTVTASVEVTSWQPQKRILTLRTDCYNQDGRQVVTGQAVLMVPVRLNREDRRCASTKDAG